MSAQTIARNPDWDSALALFASAVRTQPNSCKARVCLAAALKERGKYDEALMEIAEAANINPRYAGAYFLEGNIFYHNLKDLYKAEMSYKKAIMYGLPEGMARKMGIPIRKEYQDMVKHIPLENFVPDVVAVSLGEKVVNEK